MSLDDDAQLLRRYAARNDEGAFAEVVRRHLGPVYAVALRQVGGDTHLAHDVVQLVFTALARKAASLANRPALGGWLYRTTHYAARDVVRSERRRRVREQEASTMQERATDSDAGVDWDKLRPALDSILSELGDVDRDAVWLRFFEGRGFAEIGARLRLTENAARMRVERALQKLHAALGRRGVTSSTGALAVVLGQQGVGAVPAGLHAAVASAAIKAAAIGGGGFLGTLGGVFLMSKINLAVTGALVIAAGGMAVRELRASRALAGEISELRRTAQAMEALRQENERLATSAMAVAGTNPEAAELLRVERRIEQMKARPESVNEAEMKPVDSFRNAGWSTPAAAYETQLWARVTGRWDEFANAFGWTAKGKAKLDAFFAALPEHIRVQHGTPERMLAPMAGAWGRSGQPVAVQITGQTEHGIKIMVHAWARYGSGEEKKLDLLFQRYEDGWRLPHPDEMIEKIIASLDPKTGERIPTVK
jgi:RNA polymerase sigma factor (sigma-70 family)